MVDASNCPVDVAFALAAEVQGSGLGRFEGIARSVGLYLFRDRLDLCKDWRRSVDSDRTQSKRFAGVPRGITQGNFTIAVLSVPRGTYRDFRFIFLGMEEITTAVS